MNPTGVRFNHKAATLWMGDLEPYMDERFVKDAFGAMGERVIYVKIVKNSAPFGYCFVEFENEDHALRVLHRLNGKPIPNTSTSQVDGVTVQKRFKLNHSNSGQAFGREFSLFVGDLTPEVDDQILFKVFVSRFSSCKSAKVVLDISGRSRGYGFVRFADECDQQQALIQMQNFTGVGSKPIRVSLATPKRQTTATTHVPGQAPPVATAPTVDYSAYYQNYEQYQNYYNQQWDYSQYYYGYNYGMAADGTQMTDPTMMQGYEAMYEMIDTSVEEHDVAVDVDECNNEYMEMNDDFYDALDNSRWLPPDTLDYGTIELK